MAFDPPLITDEIDLAIGTKTAGSLLALRDGSAIFGTQGGTGDDYTATFDPPFTALNDGMVFVFKPTSSNGGASTLKIDSILKKPIVKWLRGGLSALVSGDLLLNGLTLVQYSSPGDRFHLLSPSQITDPMLSANVAFKNAALILTNTLKMSSTVPGVIFDQTAGGNYSILRAEQSGVVKWFLQVQAAQPSFALLDSGAVVRVGFDMTDGRMTVGRMPLLRIRTAADAAVFDSSDKMIAGTVPLDRIRTQNLTVENGSVSDGTIVSINLGSGLLVGDMVIASVEASWGQNATTAGVVIVKMQENGAGAGSVNWAGSQVSAQVRAYNEPSAIGWLNPTFIGHVTAPGQYTLQITIVGASVIVATSGVVRIRAQTFRGA